MTNRPPRRLVIFSPAAGNTFPRVLQQFAHDGDPCGRVLVDATREDTPMQFDRGCDAVHLCRTMLDDGEFVRSFLRRQVSHEEVFERGEHVCHAPPHDGFRANGIDEPRRCDGAQRADENSLETPERAIRARVQRPNAEAARAPALRKPPNTHSCAREATCRERAQRRLRRPSPRRSEARDAAWPPPRPCPPTRRRGARALCTQRHRVRARRCRR